MLSILNYHKTTVVQDKLPLLNTKFGEAHKVLATIMQTLVINGHMKFCLLLCIYHQLYRCILRNSSCFSNFWIRKAV